MKIENPVIAELSPMAWLSWNELVKDFEPVVERMIGVLHSRVPKYGLSYRENDDISYYFNRMKQEIEEFGENPSPEEAADIANFAMMIIYHLLRKEVLS